MQRRSDQMAGCVAFPVTDPNWPTSGEGGMVVKLVVLSDVEFDDPANPAVCAGAQVFDVLTEVLVGDDKRPQPECPSTYEAPEAVTAEMDIRNEWESFHYPALHDVGAKGVETALSRDYLASIVMGSTGWSGHNAEAGEYWTCTFEDLTEAGKALYRQMAAIYPSASLHLLTFLDT